ncbi:MAG: glycosyl hydrolase family 65 protein [Eubacteriales bacterium]|nr:glycosyl hydrolase family 65 protein [Eubacteriales bacterium]
MGMDYSAIKDWILREDSFDPEKLGKCEAVMSLGNGYLGLRSAAEERYLNETRGLFVAGTFNKFDENEVTELPNAADMTAIKLSVNGEIFSLTEGAMEDYARELNIRTGELKRSVIWTSPKGTKIKAVFYRIVSLKRLHVIAQRVELTPLDADVKIEIKSGINGKMTNTGSQHFSDGDKRFYDKRVIQFVQTTGQSKIDFVDTTVHKLALDGEVLPMEAEVYIERREIFAGYNVEVKAGQTLSIEKYSTVYTTRDLDAEGKTAADLQKLALETARELEALGYQALLEESARQWEEEVWNLAPIEIEGCEMDEFAVHFAQYHLRLMVPAHDARMNIGAKGLSGEGYRGHTFWDTEIFLLPYYIFTDPKTARKLEEYRYLSLPGAHAKAAHNHYKGAMFPWESAWLDDGEVTPEYMDVDILTGKPNKVWSGFIEQHITSDVAFGVWQYSVITGDEDYMEKYGYELIMDTAIFWASRLEKGTSDDNKYHINDVVGPDEYREHVNDNAFTNYMAHWNMQKAMEYYHLLKKEKPEIFARLNEKLNLEEAYPQWENGCANLYLPVPTKENILPQDDRYLSCRDIDLGKYKAQEHVGGITRDYNLEQINQIQVSKQADVLVLFFLLEDIFPQEVKKASWEYYEKRTLHDSSLSLSTHSVLACDMGEMEMAYDLFRKAAAIDLGPFMGSSNAGIHAASFGGVWECVVYGFGGVRMLGGRLRINPSLPEKWTKLSYTIIWKGQKLAVEVTKDEVHVTNLTGTKKVEIEVNGEARIL